MLFRQIAEPLHLLFVGVGNPRNLRQNLFPLPGAAVAEKPLRLVGAFAEAGLLLLLA
jgi:hypothetical protein